MLQLEKSPSAVMKTQRSHNKFKKKKNEDGLCSPKVSDQWEMGDGSAVRSSHFDRGEGLKKFVA